MKTDKDLYRQLRTLSCEKLWNEEVARFDQASPQERVERVAVIRAVGVVFAATATVEQRAAARVWLARLLQDPAEKIRRYAMAAMPKLGAGLREETELLSLLKTTTGEREKKYLGRALDKIGGAATLDVVRGAPGLLPQTELKVKASLARKERPSAIRLDQLLKPPAGLRVHLRCRRGLESIVRDEVVERLGRTGQFRIADVRSGLVALTALTPFTLNNLYALRCFATINLPLGTVPAGTPEATTDALAGVIASPLSRQLLTTLTEGSLRYRLDFVARSHQRGAVRELANRAFAKCPDMLNDARSAPWSMDIHPAGLGLSVELRPRLSPDPRFYYREGDVAAASHPPLAACMARLAGRVANEIVWDPFCGSGLELVECALLGGVKQVYGTDISPEAVAVAQANFAAAKLAPVVASFRQCEFRQCATLPGLGPSSVTLVVSNPPMGRRIRIPDMRGLYSDFFAVAATALKPGGRLVFPNPLRLRPQDPSLQLQSSQVVDLGGYDCRLERYLKTTP
jgi:23S rRNA G2445 N2-methylase RlmL